MYDLMTIRAEFGQYIF